MSPSLFTMNPDPMPRTTSPPCGRGAPNGMPNRRPRSSSGLLTWGLSPCLGVCTTLTFTAAGPYWRTMVAKSGRLRRVAPCAEPDDGVPGAAVVSTADAASVLVGWPRVSAPAANAQAARNLATNSIGQTGKGVASTGSAVSTKQETMIPLSAVAYFTRGATPLAVNHQGLLVATTISFNLPPNVSLSTAIATIDATMNKLGVPATIRGTYQGTAKVFQDSLANQPFLILAALVTIYIVLGVLYESYIHPLTILSTLPSAGVGALLALMAFNTEFSIMALIGVILLIGIVKKNAIMMIDFALEAERKRGLSSIEAIREACLLRFRPIMMTTMAAMLGALPLALGMGDGGELRQPLGISIVGGLILSQALTLYSTPVIYLYLDRFRLWSQRFRGDSAPHTPGPSLQPGE